MTKQAGITERNKTIFYCTGMNVKVLLLKEGKRYINGGKRNSPRKETSRKNKNKNTPF